MQAILINNKEADILDLYNVDYVCKVEFVPGEYRVEQIEGEADAQVSADSSSGI